MVVLINNSGSPGKDQYDPGTLKQCGQLLQIRKTTWAATLSWICFETDAVPNFLGSPKAGLAVADIEEVDCSEWSGTDRKAKRARGCVRFRGRRMSSICMLSICCSAYVDGLRLVKDSTLHVRYRIHERRLVQLKIWSSYLSLLKRLESPLASTYMLSFTSRFPPATRP